MPKPRPKKDRPHSPAMVKAPESDACVLSPRRSIASIIWPVIFSIAVALVAISTIATVIRTYTPLPRWDQWAEVLWLKNYYAGQWHISDLWRQHNEHRILFPRFFILADWFIFGGANIFLLASILILQAGHAWIFIREVRNRQDWSVELRLIAGGIIVALFFSGANLDNFTWPFQISFILAFYSATLSIYALIRYAEVRRDRTRRGPEIAWLAASVACGFIATNSLANGLFIWPVLLGSAIVLGLPRRVLLLVGSVSALAIFLFFFGYQRFPGHTNGIAALKTPVAVLGYMGAYLAVPLAKINHALGAVVGISALCILAWITYRILRRRVFPRLVILSLAVMWYITAGAFVTALGRLEVAPPENALRYGTPVSIFWVCALLVALAEADTVNKRPVVIAATVATAISGLVMTILPLHLQQVAAALQFVPAIRDAESAIRAGVDAKSQIAAVYPDPASGFPLIEVLRAHRRSIFRDASMVGGESLPPEYSVIGRDLCRGAWEATTPVDGAAKPAEAVSGWAWDSGANRRPERVVIMEDRVIRGFGEFTRDRDDVAAAFHRSGMTASGWFGFAQGNALYRAYALLSDQRSLCPLSNSDELPKSVLAVFRGGQWFINSNKSGTWEPEDRTFGFGIAGDLPVSGDWDGSGVTRAGVFRNGQWFLDWNNDGRSGHPISFGLPGDIPVVGDWNHTGVTKLGVFRNGLWILSWSSAQDSAPVVRQFTFGVPGDIPVAGDWNGSGATRIGIYRKGLWYLDTDGDFQFDSRDKAFAFGLPDDRPVTGDWTGLGPANIGIFRNGQWILDSNGNRQYDATDRSASFGLPGDLPVLWK